MHQEINKFVLHKDLCMCISASKKPDAHAFQANSA